VPDAERIAKLGPTGLDELVDGAVAVADEEGDAASSSGSLPALLVAGVAAVMAVAVVVWVRARRDPETNGD
jgi:hypothetical protein